MKKIRGEKFQSVWDALEDEDGERELQKIKSAIQCALLRGGEIGFNDFHGTTGKSLPERLSDFIKNASFSELMEIAGKAKYPDKEWAKLFGSKVEELL